MKLNMNRKRFVLFAIITIGLILLTGSIPMSVGILLLLLVADHFIGVWEENHNNKSEENNDKSE